MARPEGSSFEAMLLLTLGVVVLVAVGNYDLPAFTDLADDTVRAVARRIGVDL
jgi:hypothetical protein